MEYKSFPTSHTWVASLASEYAKEVIEEEKSLIKDKLAQALLSTKQKHINQKDMLASICTWRENIRE